ncbi:hypothetical protein GDO78_014227 [Eleutherodactylus coqui]|uniref:Uncharacterized protein n=1 Tax=Eleutherodactylus coqui TaxID=57060 RepID=A0A8J6E8Y4_ELECQ|nr:hypothetical protein GDO78_014227 [Eleutherodactylus coqui]
MVKIYGSNFFRSRHSYLLFFQWRCGMKVQKHPMACHIVLQLWIAHLQLPMRKPQLLSDSFPFKMLTVPGISTLNSPLSWVYRSRTSVTRIQIRYD